MCDANIVSYFKSTLIPAHAGLDSITRLKVISFLAGVASAFKTHLPVEPKTDCREQFTAGRNSNIRDKILRTFADGQVNINGAYYDAGLNLSWRILYDLVYSPVDRSLQSCASLLILGVDPQHEIDTDIVIGLVNAINFEFKHDLTGKVTTSFWSRGIKDGWMEQMNSAERENIIAEHVGIALGYYLDQPSSDVNSLNSFWTVTHQNQVMLYLSAVNEHMHINIDKAADVAKLIWLNRAELVAGTFTPVVVLSKLVIPTNPDVPQLFKDEGWLPKIMDNADLFEKMICEVKAIQEPENADVRVAMHAAPGVPVNGFNLMRNIMD